MRSEPAARRQRNKRYGKASAVSPNVVAAYALLLPTNNVVGTRRPIEAMKLVVIRTVADMVQRARTERTHISSDPRFSRAGKSLAKSQRHTGSSGSRSVTSSDAATNVSSYGSGRPARAGERCQEKKPAKELRTTIPGPTKDKPATHGRKCQKNGDIERRIQRRD